MGAAMSNEMDQSDSWFESFQEEIASMTPQQQEPIPNPRPLPPEPPTWLPILVHGAPPPVGIGPACWDGAPPPVGIGPACWDATPVDIEPWGAPGEMEGWVGHAAPVNIRLDPCNVGDVKEGVCISKVVHTIRDIKPDVYTPKFFSIGPFHHQGNDRLKDMQKRKQVLCDRFRKTRGVNLDVLRNRIKYLVRQVRDSYSEDFELISNRDFVELILNDAVFIIEIFLSVGRDGQKEIFAADSTPSLSPLAILGTLPLDLVLFENQLPFFVLKELFDIAFPGDNFLELACWYFSEAFGLKMPEALCRSINHFTDLVRFLLLPGATPITMKPYSWTTDKLLYSAKELQELGVKFKVSKSKSILDIRFSDPVLELPKLLVADPVTDALFSNMVAFEQLHCSPTSYITNYVTLWSDLINTEEDVRVLVDKKIIQSFVPHTEVVTLFRSMGRSGFQATMLPGYIDIFKELNEFCKNRCNQNIATLRRDYCRTPWQVVGSVAGGCLLILALLQTIFTIKK